MPAFGSNPGAETSMFHDPPVMPRTAHFPFLSVLRSGPCPFSRSCTVASAIGFPLSSTTVPSSRPPPPRQACADIEAAKAKTASASKPVSVVAVFGILPYRIFLVIETPLFLSSP